MYNYKIKTNLVCPKMPKTRPNKTGINFFLIFSLIFVNTSLRCYTLFFIKAVWLSGYREFKLKRNTSTSILLLCIQYDAIHNFSVLLRTCSNPADINWFGSHTGILFIFLPGENIRSSMVSPTLRTVLGKIHWRKSTKTCLNRVFSIVYIYNTK